jgi:hypothetical protein
MPKQTASKKITEKAVYIKTVDGSLIRGKINLGLEKRISDVFVKSETPFIVVYDVGDPSLPKKVLVVNKNHIVWVEPDETGLS